MSNIRPASDFTYPTHHIDVNGERLVLSRLPEANEPPTLDEVGAGEQCEGCGRDILAVLRYWPDLDKFECSECGNSYPVYEGGYLDHTGYEEGECRGHPAGPFDLMGETVYCDGSCRPRRRR